MGEYANVCMTLVANQLPVLISLGTPARQVSQSWAAILWDRQSDVSLLGKHLGLGHPACPANNINLSDPHLRIFLEHLARQGVDIVQEYEAVSHPFAVGFRPAGV